MKRFVLYSDELGVYVSASRWTKPTHSDTELVVTFASVEALKQHVTRWPTPPPTGWRAVEVKADGAGHATIAACAVSLGQHTRFADHLAICDACNNTQEPCDLGKALIDREDVFGEGVPSKRGLS